jgi:hypothetical protein
MEEGIGDEGCPIGQPGEGRGIDIAHDDRDHAEIDRRFIKGGWRQRCLDGEDQNIERDQPISDVGKSDMAMRIDVMQGQEQGFSPRVRGYSRDVGLQTAIFCASGAHVLMYAPLRFSKIATFASP